ncbi:MAG: tocopherol cyclase family protein [Culicoidibacterales bacterium]
MAKADGFHGGNKTRHFFEGWYLKMTNREQTETFALIPGIFYGEKASQNHCFLQVLHGSQVSYEYLSFPAATFSASSKDFDVQILENHFSKMLVDVNVKLSSNEKFSAKIKIAEQSYWPSTIVNPGSMGFFNYLPLMECYMQTVMMNGVIHGEITIGAKSINMDGGSIYIEKNWGRSFPKAWIWIQANQFLGKQKVSLSCSVGKVPLLGRVIDGFLIGLAIDEAFYTFRTNSLAKVALDLSFEIPIITVSNRTHQLIIEACAPKNSFMLCKGPVQSGEMMPFVEETLQGKVAIRLTNKQSGRVIYEGYSPQTGIELTNRQLFKEGKRRTGR